MKKAKKLLQVVCIYVMIVAMGFFSVNTNAIGTDAQDSVDFKVAMQRAYGKFSMTISQNSMTYADSSFKMDKGQSVTIKALYSPSSASVDFGVLDADNKFYYMSGMDGSFYQEIVIEKSGTYTLAIRNNSSQDVEVNGFVYY